MMQKKQLAKQRSILATAHHDYEKMLNVHAFYRTSSHLVGEDLVQDTFVKTWKYLLRGGKIDVMKSFLYHVLNGLIIDEYRKQKSLSLDLMMESGFEPGADSEDQLMNMLDGKQAMLLIARLPEKYRDIIDMRYVRDLSLQEISLITGKSKNSIAVQAHRGLEKLRVIYDLQ